MSNMAALSTLTFDPEGFVLLSLIDDAELGITQRRVNRVATLDGGAAVNDYGFSDADRIIELRWRPLTRAQESNLKRLVQQYASLVISTADGVFLASPETYTPGAEESSMRLLVVARLSS
jgi:hypothetical protein